ncbi:MAG: NUDIX hydrolase [Lysobacterales bacterium 14-68-21]|nr:MAG: NUDIX hydrolase [Xanthomonadales bacterium 15-68-25]OZB68014.1 MAG: NUDIX hydrolase [Xanthomonadales bacterium 14-68-21]
MSMSRALHVMAGVLRRPDGAVLTTERPPGKHLAGLWEFPGGKLEPDELPFAGLVRELREELGIQVREAYPLLTLPWRYEAFHLLLDTWIVTAWDGTPSPLEGQGLQWHRPEALVPSQLAPADQAILRTLLGS